MAETKISIFLVFEFEMDGFWLPTEIPEIQVGATYDTQLYTYRIVPCKGTATGTFTGPRMGPWEWHHGSPRLHGTIDVVLPIPIEFPECASLN